MQPLVLIFQQVNQKCSDFSSVQMESLLHDAHSAKSCFWGALPPRPTRFPSLTEKVGEMESPPWMRKPAAQSQCNVSVRGNLGPRELETVLSLFRWHGCRMGGPWGSQTPLQLASGQCVVTRNRSLSLALESLIVTTLRLSWIRKKLSETVFSQRHF